MSMLEVQEQINRGLKANIQIQGELIKSLQNKNAIMHEQKKILEDRIKKLEQQNATQRNSTQQDVLRNGVRRMKPARPQLFMYFADKDI